MTPAARSPLADVAPQPWRNGGGVTRELLAWPAAGDWRRAHQRRRDRGATVRSRLPGRRALVRRARGRRRRADARRQPSIAAAPAIAPLSLRRRRAPRLPPARTARRRDLNLMLRGTARPRCSRSSPASAWHRAPRRCGAVRARSPARCRVDGDDDRHARRHAWPGSTRGAGRAELRAGQRAATPLGLVAGCRRRAARRVRRTLWRNARLATLAAAHGLGLDRRGALAGRRRHARLGRRRGRPAGRALHGRRASTTSAARWSRPA